MRIVEKSVLLGVLLSTLFLSLNSKEIAMEHILKILWYTV